MKAIKNILGKAKRLLGINRVVLKSNGQPQTLTPAMYLALTQAEQALKKHGGNLKLELRADTMVLTNRGGIIKNMIGDIDAELQVSFENKQVAIVSAIGDCLGLRIQKGLDAKRAGICNCGHVDVRGPGFTQKLADFFEAVATAPAIERPEVN